MNKHDVVIVGAGIAGVTLAIYLKRANIDFVLLEGNEFGGKLNKIHKIENYPGLISISGEDFIQNLAKQMEYLHIELTKGLVQTILKNDFGFETKTDVDSYLSKVVVIASGIQNSSDLIEGEKEFLGRGVSYCATCDGNFFKGYDVAVYGNNDIALEETLYLSNLAKKIYLISPDSKLNGPIDLIKKINESLNVEVLLNSRVNKVSGDEFGVSELQINEQNIIAVNGFFPYVGHKSNADILSNLHVSLKNNTYIVTDNNYESSVRGLFAIGDVVDKKVRQLATASNDAVVAASSIGKYLRK